MAHKQTVSTNKIHVSHTDVLVIWATRFHAAHASPREPSIPESSVIHHFGDRRSILESWTLALIYDRKGLPHCFRRLS